MRKLKSFVGGVVLAVLFVCSVALAATFTSVGTLTAVNNTTSNGASFTATTLSGSGALTVQNSGAATNTTFLVYDQISLDGTNFMTVGTNMVSVNAGASTNFYPAFATPVYRRAQIVTTNSVNVSATYQY
jgi:hypothetical protein